MKKMFLVVVILILFIGVDVLALNRFDVDSVSINNKDLDLEEELTPIYEESNIVGFNLTTVIPYDYEKDIVVINPDMFKGVNNYKHIMPGEEICINLKVINKSKYNYKYKRNSFKISTDDLSRYTDSSNYSIIGKGFDKLDIYDNFSIYRVYNEAISSLYKDSYKNEYLESDNLDRKLKSIGYSIEYIDKYFLDYFNNKYNLDEEDLNNFTYSVIKEIFTGKISLEKEENTNINSLAYNYYYNKLLYILPREVLIDKFESDNYSIGEYMRNSDLCNTFNMGYLRSGEEVINNIKLGINDYYYSEVFNDYNLSGNLEFILEKDNYINPPNTGI